MFENLANQYLEFPEVIFVEAFEEQCGKDIANVFNVRSYPDTTIFMNGK